MADTNGRVTRSAFDRIANAVRKVESTPQDRTGHRRPLGHREESFWAKLTTCTTDGRLYSWTRVQPIGGGVWAPYAPAEEGVTNALEINGNVGAMGKIVRLQLTDYDGDGKPRYTFQLDTPTPAPLPIHDHRDNTSGGFAFAAYHPGTALPQQPWAI